MRYRFVTADVFTDQPFGGNPLAVFLDGRGLSTRTMQRVAREMNLSETVFVLPPDDIQNTRCLRIFTPAVELPFAGHPTVGAAFVLAALGELPRFLEAPGEVSEEEIRIVFEEGVGPVPVAIRMAEGKPVFAQLSVAKLPEVGAPPPATADVAAMLSLQPEDVLDDGRDFPQAFSCGAEFLFVPLRDLGAVRRARLRADLCERLLGTSGPQEVYLFSYGGELAGSDLHARMFSASLGIGEDPATGAAVAALGGYLGTRARETAPEADATLRWTVEQGFEAGRPSLLYLEVDKNGGQIAAVRVGGSAVLMGEGTLEIREAGPEG